MEQRRIAFVDHVAHERTGSSAFAREIVAGLGDMTVRVAGRSAAEDDSIVEAFVRGEHAHWIFFQSDDLAARLVPLGLRGAVLVPMLERVHSAPDAYFQQFVLSRFASFSRALHHRLQRLHLRSAAFAYVPSPESLVERSFARDDWSAFFWERTPHAVPNAASVIAQCRILGIPKLHVHRGADDGGEAGAVDAVVRLGRLDGVEVTTSRFGADAAAFRAVARQAPIVFASRPFEGLGLATLEAMAAGQVVIAPDLPAANETIGHLASGILYDLADPETVPELSPERLAALSAGARARIAAGRADWEADVARFSSFVLDDGRRWSATDSSAGFARDLARRVHDRRRNWVTK